MLIYCKSFQSIETRKKKFTSFNRNQSRPLVYKPCGMYEDLRTPVRKYREFRDSKKKSNFFLFFQKVPFDELFSKKICKRSSAFYFLRNEENSKM